MRPYATELEQTVRTVSALNLDYTSVYFTERPDNRQSVVLVLSSDKGLCGGYNSAIAKAVRRLKAEKTGEQFKFFFIGKKARDLVQKEVNVGKTFKFAKVDPTLEEIRKVSDELSAMFINGEVGKVYVLYNSFLSAIAFNTTLKQLLPLVVSEQEREALKARFPFDYKYEPSAQSILDTLVPEVFITSVYTASLDAIASEHGARMSAMESASKNSKELIRKLSLKMNKLRQAKITTELAEVVSGAESLNG
jgi:F-type H+-transporting ATPase subunit gamma